MISRTQSRTKSNDALRPDAGGNYGSDRWLMAQALQVALWGLGRTAPNPSVGAAIFSPELGCLVARGTTAPGGRPHAEPIAIERAGVLARGATMAVTLEPCSHHGRSPPCVDAIIRAGLARVIFAQVDPDPRVAGRGVTKLKDAGVSVCECDGDQAATARWITRGHILRVTERRPFVQLKMAVGANGRIARAEHGAPVWVTGAASRERGHLLRAMSDAIVVGTGTAADDDPSLTCRLPGLERWSPRRVVVGDRELPADAQIFQQRNGDFEPTPTGVTLRAVSEAATGHTDPTWQEGAQRTGAWETIVIPSPAGRVFLPALMEQLVSRGITRLLVEGGPATWRSFADARLVDEIVLFHARGDRQACVSVEDALRALEHYIPDQAIASLDLFENQPSGLDDMFVFRAREATGWSQSEKQNRKL